MRKLYMKKKLTEREELGYLKPSAGASTGNPVILDPRRKSPSESPSQFAIRALTQMEEGLKTYEAKNGTLRQPRPKNKQSGKNPLSSEGK